MVDPQTVVSGGSLGFSAIRFFLGSFHQGTMFWNGEKRLHFVLQGGYQQNAIRNSYRCWFQILCFFLYVHPDPWRNDPIWRIFLEDGLKPETTNLTNMLKQKRLSTRKNLPKESSVTLQWGEWFFCRAVEVFLGPRNSYYTPEIE